MDSLEFAYYPKRIEELKLTIEEKENKIKQM